MQSASAWKRRRLLALILVAGVATPRLSSQQTVLDSTGSDTTEPGAQWSQIRQGFATVPVATQGVTLQQQDGTVVQRGVGQTTLPEATGLGQVLPVSTTQRVQAASFPAPRPTEFQQLVQQTVGTPLPIFGAALFDGAPSTFAPVDRVPVTPEYVIGPGDELLIQAWGQVTLNGHFTVDRAGEVYVPQVGPIHVAGLPFAQLQSFVKSQMSRVFRNFDVNVNMGQLRSIQVFVVGQARRPGSYTLSSLSTLVNAIFATGGPTPQGSMRHIQLKRGDKLVVELDLYDLLLHGDKSKDQQLLPGDVIYFPTVGPEVAIAGSVNTPAIYELRAGETAGDAVRLAGGLTSVARTDGLRLERIEAQHQRSVLNLAWDASGQATTLLDGDIVEVPAISDEFKNSVTLRGNVANPGRYAWHPGMRIRDLIPDRDALVTRDYWHQRARLGQSVLNYIAPDTTTKTGTKAEVQQAAGVRSLTQQSGTTLAEQSNATGRAASYQQQTMAEVEQPAVSGQNPSVPLADSSSANSTNGSTGSAEVGVASTLFPPKTFVVASGPDINWSYASIDRQDKTTLTTSILPFHLGAVVLDGDESQNLELLPGDVVTIFSKADMRVPESQQTRFVRLEGEFVAAGVYTVKPGETLRQLVMRAGGLTPDAYLYGSDFTRESTRRAQQQRLNDYANELERQASGAILQAANNSVSQQDTAAATTAQQQSEQLVARLRQIQASGRIVLNFPVDAKGSEAIPDLPLEDGDRFLVPRIPSTVAVVGAVYNANAFLYQPNERLGRYLKMAGGSNRDADPRREFVVHADGSVISRQYSSSFWSGNFESVRLYPGDTIVVPQSFSKGSALRRVVDIATIAGQFGLAAAAINLVR